MEKKVQDYYHLKRLDPSYRIYWDDGFTDVPASYDELRNVFEQFEPGSAERLDQFFTEAEFKYEKGINKMVHKPGLSITEFFDWDVIKGVFRLDVFSSIQKHIHKYFHHTRLRQMMEFPVLFLSSLPENTPALYSLMKIMRI